MPQPLKSVDQHLHDILALAKPLEPFAMPLLESHGTTLAVDVHSKVALPPWDNSAMDGFAVRAAEIFPERPMEIAGEVAAGNSESSELPLGKVLRIMTGAPVPQGCDAVIPVEWSREEAGMVYFDKAPAYGAHIRNLGSDINVGDLILSAGTKLNATHIGAAAAIGVDSLITRPHPRVVLISTGDELVEPGLPLSHGQIYDANSWLLTTATREAGAIAYRVGAVPDNEEKFMQVLEDQLVRADLIVTSGGVSQGVYDTVKNVLATLGSVTFESVAMQPGMPQGYGLVGPDSTPIITLPGNPVSAYVSFELFVRPMIKALMGVRDLERPIVEATLMESVKSPLGKRSFLRGYASFENGTYAVAPVAGQGSHMLGGLSQSNALIIVSEDIEQVSAGSQVRVMLLGRD
jgi:molybdopterin molybdotransferase